jgi:hypothetical protein
MTHDIAEVRTKGGKMLGMFEIDSDTFWHGSFTILSIKTYASYHRVTHEEWIMARREQCQGGLVGKISNLFKE